ncbi:MAG: alpha/beta hydrolase [Proteobacteria bacterium]|nr:alpha/beta hydrolase [Pseudomonadota bacterium]
MPDAEIRAIRAILAASPRPPDLPSRRARLDAVFGNFPLAPGAVAEAADADGVPAEWTSVPAADTSRAMLYLHGGGYVSGSIASHRSMVSHLGAAAGIRTLALDYRRAPEAPFPAACEDSLAGYRFLLRQGYTPDRIVIAGDSAGGGLTMATLMALRDAGETLPAGGFCISPWVDLMNSGESMAGKAEIDPMIGKAYLDEIAAQYLNGADAEVPRASPLYGSLTGLPPLLVQVGTAETLLDDSTRLAARAAAADVRVTLSVYPEMIHVWHLFHANLAPARAAIAEAGAWMRWVLGLPPY